MCEADVLPRCAIIGRVRQLAVFLAPSVNAPLARRSLLIAAAIQPDSLDMVLTRLLVCFFRIVIVVIFVQPL